MMVRPWMLVILLPAVMLFGFTAKTLWDAGEFKRLAAVSPGLCQVVEGVSSSEDITIDQARQLAYISSADRRGNQPGAIFSYSLSRANPRLLALKTDLEDLNPHGISLFENGEQTLLFVVNHRSDGHFVERFEVLPDRLRHLESFSAPEMNSPNDVVAVGERQFYVTNDHRSQSNWGRAAEEYLQLSRSYLLYFDGREFQIAAAGIAYANGVNVSRDGQWLYVAASVGRSIHVYKRDPESGRLQLDSVIDAGSGVDNIELAADGSLWIGAHPKLLTFAAYMDDPTEVAPSQVLQLTLFPKHNYQFETIYQDDGHRLSASSVAAVTDDRLLIGSVADARFLDCRR